MFINLPKKFPLDKISQFTFGNVEGKNDELLTDPICICKINGIEEFLDGGKSIVVGERGAGKTALFRLVASGYFRFRDSFQQKNIILPIDEELQYHTIKAKLTSLLTSSSIGDNIQYRFIWEIFIIYRIMIRLREEFHGRLPDALKKAIAEYDQIFGKKKKDSIADLIGSVKRTVGFKIDTSPFGNPVPNFYLSVEPTSTTIDYPPESIPIINLDKQKQEISDFLQSNRSVLHVLLDKLDEFVIKDDYETQKQVLQGLLFVEKAYDSYKNISIKIFLRSDLFMKMDFEELGYDKVSPKVVRLFWSNEDIRAFIARRIFYNFMKVFEMTKIGLTIDEEKLYLDRSSIETFYMRESKTNFMAKRVFKLEIVAKKLLNCLGKHFLKYFRDQRTGRRINFLDEVNRQVITSIFPKVILHNTTKNKDENISLFKFIETHFTLGTGNTTPRIMVMFLDKCLSLTKSYYKQNPYDSVELDDHSEYPLIKRELVLSAYKELQDLIQETFAKISSRWELPVKTLKSRKGGKFTFSFNEMKRFSGIDDDIDLRDFLAFLCHVGYLRCQDSTKMYVERTYFLPILFR